MECRTESSEERRRRANLPKTIKKMISWCSQLCKLSGIRRDSVSVCPPAGPDVAAGVLPIVVEKYTAAAMGLKASLRPDDRGAAAPSGFKQRGDLSLVSRVKVK